MVEENNGELTQMREQFSSFQKQYFSLKVKNETLEQELEALKSERDMKAALNEERRVNQMKVNI